MAVWIALGAVFMGLTAAAVALFAAGAAKEKPKDGSDAR